MFSLHKLRFILPVVFIAIIGSCIYFYQQTNAKSLESAESERRQTELSEPSKSPSKSSVVPKATLMPFSELTIPHLRNREYNSKLANLSKLGESTNYTTYLTSYSSDNLKINGLLTQPKGEMPPGGWPAVVFVHGYIPPTLYKTQEKYIEYVNYLANSGLVVFKIDLRGHGSSEGEPGGSYYSSDYIVDTLNAYSALQAADFVNPQQIGLWGHSMAGNVTLRSLAAKPEIRAVVIWGGAGFTYSDLGEFGIDDNSYRPPTDDTNRQRKRQELFNAHGQFNADSAFWKQVVPTSYLKEVKSALQLHHAIDDTVVSVKYSRNLDTVLDDTEVTHELHEYTSGGHNISGSSFAQAIKRTADFYNTHLK